MRALVIDDDELVVRLDKLLLERDGFDVDTALTAREGARLASANAYALIILDMILPDGNGMDVLKAIREASSTTPVLIVSGKDDVGSTVNGLDAGADDYLQKPYQREELMARVHALLRRGQVVESPHIDCGNVRLHRLGRYATVADQPLALTAKEFALLEYFIMNRGKTLTRKELLEKVWRFDFDPGTNLVDVNVSRLRTKLVGLGARCRLEAERGVGYVFHEQ